uniref:Uncharacterized protein n=1 Tax=Anguilla anguilla TaxID=7936 RepID=A0A0E9R848_ANGAN
MSGLINRAIDHRFVSDDYFCLRSFFQSHRGLLLVRLTVTTGSPACPVLLYVTQ